MGKKNINNVKLGKDVKIFDFVNLYGCFIDDNSKIGTFVEIQKNSKAKTVKYPHTPLFVRE